MYNGLKKLYLIKGHFSKTGCIFVADAQGFYNSMKEAGFMPTMKSHMLLLSSYAKAGQVTDAENFVQELQRVGVELDTFIFNSLLSTYGNSGR